MNPQRIVIPLTTDASGDCIAYSDSIKGVINTLRYIKNNFENGVDFTVTMEATGQSIWAESDVNASATRAPRQVTHSPTGEASDNADAAMVIANDRIKVVVAQGGNVKSGALHVTLV